MSGPAADFIPTALACWLALSYFFLGKAPRPGPVRLAASLLLAAAALLAPVKGWMVFQWIAVFEPELSVTVAAMLFAGLVSRAGGPKLLRACDWPRALPEEGLTGERAAALWGRDRIALATCARRHAALALHARRISAGGTPAGLAKEPE